jgi:hypothetical protein
MNVSWHVQKKTDMVLCRIYRKAVTQKSMEQRAKPIDVDKEESVVLSDEYEEKSHSLTFNVSCQSNPMTEAKCFFITLSDHEGVCSSLSKTKDESSIFDCLEPIMFLEETMVLKTPKSLQATAIRVAQVIDGLSCLASDRNSLCSSVYPITIPYSIIAVYLIHMQVERQCTKDQRTLQME